MVLRTNNKFKIFTDKNFLLNVNSISNNIKFSIVIPCYNSKNTIISCINSILKQSYNNIEIIIVDDCSTDGSFEIIENFLKTNQYKNIFLYKNNENLNNFQTRLIGISKTTGDYILTVDADDTLNNNTCKKIYDNICLKLYYIFQFKINPIFNENISNADKINYQNFFKRKLISPYDFNFSLQNPYSHSIATKCVIGYKLRYVANVLLKNINTKNIGLGEDFLITFLLFDICKDCFNIDECFYNYNIGNGSSTSKKQSDYEYIQIFLKLIDTLSHEKNILQSKHKELFINYADQYCLNIIFNKIISINDEKECKQIAKQLLKYYDKQKLLKIIFDLYSDIHFSVKILEKLLPGLIDKNKNHAIKNIALCYHSLTFGGIETFLKTIISFFKSKNINVYLFLQYTDNVNLSKEDLLNVTICKLSVPDYFNKNTLIIRQNQLKQLITDYNIDLVYFNSFTAWYMIYDLITCNSTNTYTIMHCHSNIELLTIDKYNFKNVKFIFNALKYYDCVVCLSNVDSNILKIKSIKNSIFIPNCLDELFLNECKKDTIYKRDPNLYIWIGRFSKEKGLMEAIDVFNDIYFMNKQAKLLLIGDKFDNSQDKYKNQVINHINELGLNNSITFTGLLTQNEIFKYLTTAFSLIYTSKYDGYPYTVAESLACGIPILAFDQPGNELFKSTGILKATFGDIHRLSELQIKLNNPVTLNKIQMENKKFIRKLYKKYNVLHLYNKIFNSIKSNRYIQDKKTLNNKNLVDLINRFEYNIQIGINYDY